MLFPAGSRITGAGLTDATMLGILKGSDESVTSSTTLQPDNALVLGVDADTSYWWQCFLVYQGAATGSGDLKFQWSVPSGASLAFTDANYTTGAAPSVGTAFTQSSVVTAGSNGSSLVGLLMTGTLQVGATAGGMQLNWAQNTSSGTPTTVKAASALGLVAL